MASSVFFRWKSQKDHIRVAFDGTGISVFELKRQVILSNRLGDGTDFDLAIYNEDTKDGKRPQQSRVTLGYLLTIYIEYDDDTVIISRGTSIFGRRLPAARDGRGGAARYVSGKAPVNARNSSRVETTSSKPTKPTSTDPTMDMNKAMTEEERIQAMFKAQDDQWQQTQKEMANAAPVHRTGGGFKGKPTNIPSYPPGQGYVCFRCGQKGHWIQECPTNGDPTFDNRPRYTRTTGIPRALQKIVSASGADGDDTKGVMINPDGKKVMVLTDTASWEKYQEKTKVSAAQQEAYLAESKELQSRGLECSIDNRLFLDPVKTPCCGKTFCNECITNALIDNDLTCPACNKDGVLIDDLVPDKEVDEKVKAYEKEKLEKKRAESASRSPTPKNDAKSPTKSPLKDKELTSGDKRDQSKSPEIKRSGSSASSTGSAGDSKKRKAEDEPATKPIPDGPAAMKKQRSQDKNNNSSNPNQANGFQQFPFNPAFPFNPMMPPAGFSMGIPGANNFMGMPGMPGMPGMTGMPPMPMGPMNNFPMPNMNMNGGWNPMMNMDFMAQPNNMYGAGGFNNQMMPNGGFNMNAMGNPNGMPSNMNGGNNQQGKAPNTFSNQQKTTFGGDSAYERKPINPNRSQGRMRRQRSQDFKTL
jgi:protein MPE1